MYFRAVFTFLCLLIAQAACGSIARTLNASVQQMQGTIRADLDSLQQLDDFGSLPNIFCSSLNTTELFGSEDQAFTAQQLSHFRCLMLKMSDLTPELSLLTISQQSRTVEKLTSSHTDSQNCSLPHFQQEMYKYVYVKCLLQKMNQRLSQAKF